MNISMNQILTVSRNFLLLTAMIILSFQLASPVFSDEITETYDSIRIENAYIQTDPQSPVSFLRLRIANQSSGDLTLLKIKSERFERAEILMNVPGKGAVEVDGLTILQEETLALDTSHIRIELSNLKRAISLSEKIEFELQFENQTIRALADVHSG